MIEDEVDIEVVAVYRDPFLPCYEIEVAPQLQQEVLQAIHQRLFQVVFLPLAAFGKTGEFQNERIAEEVLWSERLRALFGKASDTFLIAGSGEAFVEERVYLAFQFAGRPAGGDGFRQIELPRLLIGDPTEKTIVRPTQFGTHCVPNWKKTVKLPHKAQVSGIEALPEFCRELRGEGFEAAGAVVGAVAAALFLFYDFATDLPVRLHHRRIDGRSAVRRASTRTARIRTKVSAVIRIRSSLIGGVPNGLRYAA